MKKLFLGILFLGLIVLGIVGCKKEVENSQVGTQNNKESIEFDTPKFSIFGLVIVRCVPHRNSKDCERGWGLCDCDWFPNKSSDGTNDAYKPIEMTLDFDKRTLLLKSESFVNNGHNIFNVDEDFLIPKNVFEGTKNEEYEIFIKEGSYTRLDDKSVLVDIKVK